MDGDKMLESYVRLAKYINKINAESIVKSIMFGAAIGFAVSFVFSFAGWLADFSYWWISIIIFAVVTAAVSPLAYYKKYKPDIKDVARRLDRLGLEERVITMIDLQGSDTIMAAHQLNSTIAALGGVTGKMVPIVVSVLGSIVIGVGGVLSAGMMTVHALSANNMAPSGGDIIDIIDPDPEVYFTLRYEIVYVDGNYNPTEGTGVEIEGNEEQIILEGTDAEPVLVYVESEPDDEGYGWIFLGWYDVLDFSELPTSEDPYRFDQAVTLENAGGVVTEEDGEIIITHYAIVFQQEMDGGSGGGDGEGEPSDGEGEEGDNPPDEPQEGDDESGDPNDPSDDENENKNPGSGIGGGKYDQGNQIIDGNEYYRDHLEDYLNEYQQYLENGGEIPDYLKKFIEIYYSIIK